MSYLTFVCMLYDVSVSRLEVTTEMDRIYNAMVAELRAGRRVHTPFGDFYPNRTNRTLRRRRRGDNKTIRIQFIFMI